MMTGPSEPRLPATLPVKLPLTARIEMRFAAPLRNASFARRTWFSVTVALILCAHAALLAAMLWRDRNDVTQLAKVEETPVEVVVEPPPPPPPAAPKPPAAQQEMEKPATSAPRAQNDETVEREQANDKETRAPKTVAAKSETPPPPAEEAKPQPDTVPPPKPEVIEKDAEALDRLPPEPPKRPPELAKPKPAKPVKSVSKEALQQLAGTSDLPDYTFAKPVRKRAKVSGGTEDNRYLAVVFGMIMQNRRPIPMPGGAWEVVVTFEVDAHGNLLGVGLQRSSGYRFVDAAALEAVQRAAPFPPPPSGGMTGLVARLQSGSDPSRAMLAGDN